MTGRAALAGADQPVLHAPAEPTTRPSAPRAARIVGLDGIRGLAALFVVVNHVFLRAFPGYPVDTAPFWASWFIYGRFAVVVFIVLSGFSLALSPARHGWRLDGIRPFARRRARRILPAYYAALACSLLVAWAVVPPPGQAAPNGASVLVNALLVENLIGAPSPNRSFWSMAVEAQLYLALPLLLLLVRRVGAVRMLAAVTVLVAAIDLYATTGSRLDWYVIQSPPDLAALFALGILTAGIVGARERLRRLPWPALAAAAALPVLLTIWWEGSVWTTDRYFWVDLALGPAVACLLAALATGRPAALVRLLDTRPLRALGLSSYSLYLIHGPVVVLIYEELIAGRVRPGVPTFLVTLALAVPLTILTAHCFAAVFERGYGRRHGTGPAGATRPRHRWRAEGPAREPAAISARSG
jgi:peptidoglycan/LPS O-acetylase OafA/YrhL